MNGKVSHLSRYFLLYAASDSRSISGTSYKNTHDTIDSCTPPNGSGVGNISDFMVNEG